MTLCWSGPAVESVARSGIEAVVFDACC